MKKLDVFTHIIPPRYREKAEPILRQDKNPRVRAMVEWFYEDTSLINLDERLRVLENIEDYAQILSLATPPVEELGDADTVRDLALLANDEMAEIVQKYPEQFPGFAACLPHTSPDDDLAEIERAVTQLGALGVQIHSNVRGVPLDDDAFEPMFARLSELDKAIWLHPTRSDEWPDYPTESTSRYALYWSLGWPYETSVAMARLVFSGRMQQFPKLKIITHHAGALVPSMSGRLAVPLFGPEAADVESRLDRPALDYFRRFYGDTAAFGAVHSVRCSIDFFGTDHILFGTDSPLGGAATETMSRCEAVVRATVADLDALELESEELHAIFHTNAERLLGLG